MDETVDSESFIDSRHLLSSHGIQIKKMSKVRAKSHIIYRRADDICESRPEGDGSEVLGVGVHEEGEEEVLEGPGAVHAQHHQDQDRRLHPPRVLRVGAAVDVVEDEVVGQLRRKRTEQLEPNIVVDCGSVQLASVGG